jgi:hypothetical protein
MIFQLFLNCDGWDVRFALSHQQVLVETSGNQ